MRRLLAPLALLALLAVATPAQAAAPRYIMVSGPGLKKPVMLANWRQNLAVMMEMVNGRKLDPEQRATLPGRPRLRLSLFWGWPAHPRPTRPSQTDQVGWFYPAQGVFPAVVAGVIHGRRDARLASFELMDIFRQHHVPLALP
jgi:hypothetical protein